ncbi:MAG: PAS domain S-box protein, partial [Chthoniobacteraceae bacterium]
RTPRFETVRLRKDGSRVDVELSVSPVIVDGKVVAAMAVGRDITQRRRTEESLRSHAELLALAQEGARMGVFEWDLVTNRACWTREMQELMGMELDERPANAEPWLAAMHPEDRARLERVLDEWMASKRQDATVQYRLSGNDGERWMEIRGLMIRDPGGRPLKIIGTNLDISARKQMEQALLQREAKYRQLHDTMREAFASVDMKGRIIEFNSVYQEMLGYSESELRQLTYVDLTPKKWHRFEARIIREEVIPRGFSGIYEKEYRRKDGSIFPVELHTFLIRDGKGEPEGMWAIVRDITGRKRAERALQESEARFHMVLENSVEAVFRRNLQTDSYDYLSPSIESIIGFKPEEFASLPMRRVTQMIHPADILHVRRAFKAATASGKPCRSLEYRFRCKDGAYRWLAQSFRILRDASRRPLYAVGAIRGISERKQMDEELRESQRVARSTVEAIPAQIAVIDESGTIRDVNQAWRRFARANGGTDRATGCGVNYLKVCDKVHGMGRRDAAGFAAGIRSVLSGRKAVFSMDYACHSPTERRWFTGYVTPFAGEGDRRAVVAHVNITGVKLAEEKFRDVLESAPDAMVIVDGKGKIRMVNRQTEKMFGYTRRDLIGRKLEMLLPSGKRNAHARKRENFAADPTSRPSGEGVELAARRKDGGEFPVEISLSPLQTEHGLLVCSAIRDITERKKAEDAIRTLNAELEDRVAARTAALSQANQSLQQAIQDRRQLEQEVIEISETERQRIGQDLHDDLGQQLAGLWFFSASLERSLRAAASPEAANAAKIAGMLDKALALTRSLARGLQPVVPEAGGLMAALRALAGRSSEMFKVPCRFACRRRVEVHDPAIATHLYRIAQEAVTNAGKHGKAKHISITLSMSRRKLSLSVNDDGTGIDPPEGRGGMGFRTMTYRAEAIGASLEIRRRARGGTSVVCTIPMGGGTAGKKH